MYSMDKIKTSLVFLIGIILLVSVLFTVINDDKSLVTSPVSERVLEESSMSMKNNTSQSLMEDIDLTGNSPIIIPMIDGYHNDEKVYFIHTEVSDSDMAQMMSMMVNFPTLYVPELTSISEETANVYVFTNGIAGSGPYGGGPFFFQIDIFDVVPGQEGYSQFRTPHLVTWNENSNPRLLTSVEDLFDAQANSELIIEKNRSCCKCSNDSLDIRWCGTTIISDQKNI